MCYITSIKAVGKGQIHFAQSTSHFSNTRTKFNKKIKVLVFQMTKAAEIFGGSVCRKTPIKRELRWAFWYMSV